MRGPALRWLPRRTIRLRLTLLYGALFLLSGAGLLGVMYLLVWKATSNPLVYRDPNGTTIGIVGSPAPNDPPAAMVTEAGGGGPASAPDPRDDYELGLRAHAASMHTLLLQFGIALAVMTVVSIALGWLVAGRVLRPLRTITAAVRDISAANLADRLALDGPDDELKELGDTFDGLLGRLDASFKAQRQFVANASHELRTPLARQTTLVQLAISDPYATVESLRATHQRVLVASRQQERIVASLLILARSEAGLARREEFDLAEVTDVVVGARRAEAELRGLRLAATLGPAPASGDPRLVERLVSNLVDNALRYNVTPGHITVSTGSRAGEVALSVTNSGPEVPAGQLDRLFLPFQRMAADRIHHDGGTGLGLSIVKAIAVAHGATVEATPRETGGLEITVRFPVLA
jgi:signal transduction histidine kinase